MTSPPVLLFARHYTFPERAEDYYSGGLHPVNLGDVLHNRYKIRFKLGAGSYSTIWLAEDLKHGHDYVALKIPKADVSARTQERDILDLIAAMDRKEAGVKHLPVLLNDFDIHGPNGSHLCLVFQPLGPSLKSLEYLFREGYAYVQRVYLLSISLSKEISRQILLGLDCLQRHGIVHGDLYPGNVLFAPSIRLTDDKVESHKPLKRRPRETSVATSGTLPLYIDPGEPLAEVCRLDSSVNIQLADMGSAFLLSNPPECPKACESYCAPEVFLRSTWNGSVDIWSFGCLLYELVTGHKLYLGSVFPDLRDHMIMLEDLFGRYPTAWPGRERYVNDNGDRIHAYDGRIKPDPPLEDRLSKERPHDMSSADADDLLHVLRRIFVYDINKRPTASELLQENWFSTR